MKYIVLLFLGFTYFSELSAQTQLSINSAAIIELPQGKVQDSYFLDLSSLKDYYKTEAQVKSTFYMVWDKWTYVNYSFNPSNHRVTFVLDRKNERANWTSTDWNNYFAKF